MKIDAAMTDWGQRTKFRSVSSKMMEERLESVEGYLCSILLLLVLYVIGSMKHSNTFLPLT